MDFSLLKAHVCGIDDGNNKDKKGSDHDNEQGNSGGGDGELTLS